MIDFCLQPHQSINRVNLRYGIPITQILAFIFSTIKAETKRLLLLGWITIFWTFRPQFRYSQERIIGWDISLISNKFNQLRYKADTCNRLFKKFTLELIILTTLLIIELNINSSSRNVKYLIDYRIPPCFSSAKALRYRTPQHKRCVRGILFPNDSLLSGR